MKGFCPRYYISLLERFGHCSREEANTRARVVIKKMEALTSKKRKNLPGSGFAIPASKASDSKDHLPIHDAAHVRNALARKGQLKGVSCGDDCMRRICAAAKKFGVESPLCNGSKHKERESDSACSCQRESNTGYPAAEQQGIKSRDEDLDSCVKKMLSTGKSKATARKLCQSLKRD